MGFRTVRKLSNEVVTVSVGKVVGSDYLETERIEITGSRLLDEGTSMRPEIMNLDRTVLIF